MKSSLILALATLGFTGQISSQNLLKNGGFEGSTLSPWRVTGSAVKPKLESVDVNGDGKTSQCYAFTPTSNLTSHALTQSVSVVKGRLYQYSAEYFIEFPSSNSALKASILIAGLGGVVPTYTPVLVSGKYIAKVRLVAFGICTQSSSAASFTISFMSVKGSNLAHRVHVDKVDIREFRTPFIGYNASSQGIGKSRMTGERNGLYIVGTPGAVCVTLIGFRKVSLRYSIPGFTGDTQLDPTMAFVLGVSVFGPGGPIGLSGLLLAFDVPRIPSLVGIPIYYQSFELNTLRNVANLGWEVNLPFVK